MGYPSPLHKQLGQVELCQQVSLLGRPVQPERTLSRIFRHTTPIGVGHPIGILRFGVTLFGRLT